MKLKEILEKCKDLNIYEQREELDDHIELVFMREEQEEWVKRITQYFGEPIKPADEKPKKEHLKLTDDFGGIMANQTLFYKKEEEGDYMAMFWPWNDESHVTMKLFKL